MRVNRFFAGAAIFALATSSTLAGTLSKAPVDGLTTLWNQNSNLSGGGVSSQNFTSGSYTSLNAAAADDFVVPAGETWTVRQVAISNMCYNGTCENSYNITFFANAKGLPGKVVKTFGNVVCTDSCAIGGVKLAGGTKGKTYWISVVVNSCSFIDGCGEYVWATTANVRHHQAVWENPGGGYGYCQTWEPLSSCFGIPPADLAFELRGRRS